MTLKRIALSFDDGPVPGFTDAILDILKREKITAAFFVCGAHVERHPDLAKRIVREGHLIGSHSYSHQLWKSILGLLMDETDQTHRLIKKATGRSTNLMRAPWGFITPWLEKRLLAAGYTIVPVDVFGDDWLSIDASAIAERVLARVQPGSHITLHDGHNARPVSNRRATVEALSTIISELKAQGYQFVPVTELIETGEQALAEDRELANI